MVVIVRIEIPCTSWILCLCCMVGEVLAKLYALLKFGFVLQLDELFNRLWAFFRSFVVQIYIKLVI